MFSQIRKYNETVVEMESKEAPSLLVLQTHSLDASITDEVFMQSLMKDLQNCGLAEDRDALLTVIESKGGRGLCILTPLCIDKTGLDING